MTIEGGEGAGGWGVDWGTVTAWGEKEAIVVGDITLFRSEGEKFWDLDACVEGVDVIHGFN